MAKCLNVDCVNEVFSKEGKRQKKTCSDRCRQKVWQKNRQDSKFIKVNRLEWEKLLFQKDKDHISISSNHLDKMTNQVIVKIKDIEFKEIEINKLSVPLKKEFRVIKKGESGIDYSISKREFLNNK